MKVKDIVRNWLNLQVLQFWKLLPLFSDLFPRLRLTAMRAGSCPSSCFHPMHASGAVLLPHFLERNFPKVHFPPPADG